MQPTPMSTHEDIRIELREDRPAKGMWHTGPNYCWATATHLPTMQSVTAYGRNPHRVRERAITLLEILLLDSETDLQCRFPEVMGRDT